MSKRSYGGSRHFRRHPDQASRRGIPTGALVVECSDPGCGAAPGQVIIHHLGAHTEKPGPQREEAAPAKGDPFADPSDLTSEGGSSEQRTKKP